MAIIVIISSIQPTFQHKFIHQTMKNNPNIPIQTRRNKQIIKLIQIDKKYALMDAQSQYEVSKVLQSSLDYLLGKKQKQKMKKNKLNQLQEAYEKQRERSMVKMSQKISRSDKVRNRSMNEKQLRLKRDMEYFESKTKRKMKENQQQMQKMLETRKSYIKNNSQSRITKIPSNRSLSKSFHNLSSHSHNASNIDIKISEIQQKINHAKTNRRFYHQLKSDRAKGYSKNLQETMSKINFRQETQEKARFSEYYKNSTKIIQGQERSKNHYINESQKKKKLIAQKFKKCSQNLKHIQSSRQERYEKFQQAFNRMIKPKTWTSEKNKAYLEVFTKNKLKLDIQKKSKAEAILKVHLDIGLKNKALKQQRQKIIHGVKTNDQLLA